MTLSGPLFVNRNKSPEAKKLTFFKIFFAVAHLLIETKLFVFTKISYLQPFREIMGGQRIRKFSAKMTPQAKNMTFFQIFFSVAHLHVETKLFCYYQNYISSAVQRNHGGTKKKRYIERRRTNERRTTLTMIIARQDSFRILGLIIIINKYESNEKINFI